MKMKSMVLIGLSLLATQSVLAGTLIAREGVPCGGLVSIKQEDDGRRNLIIQKIGDSSCKSVQVDSLNIKQDLFIDKTVIAIDPSADISNLSVLIGGTNAVTLKSRAQ